MWSSSRSNNRKVSQDALFLASAERMRRHWLRLGAVVLALIVAGAAFFAWERHYLRDLRVEALVEENRQLRSELESAHAELKQAALDQEIAAGTQNELERQLSELTEQYRKAREELEFVKSAGNES